MKTIEVRGKTKPITSFSTKDHVVIFDKNYKLSEVIEMILNDDRCKWGTIQVFDGILGIDMTNYMIDKLNIPLKDQFKDCYVESVTCKEYLDYVPAGRMEFHITIHSEEMYYDNIKSIF